ncbi:MAG: hypothetical protein M1133_04490 [Armatimonadetes bacterium]|nr:hypothetical protein [Armatimonadota bacterium]
MIRPEPIEGFSAIKFKEEMQARLQAQLEGLSDEEKLRKIREIAENGSLGEWWKKMRAARDARRT